MLKIKEVVTVIWSCICCFFGIVAEALGGWDFPLKALLIFMCVDFVSGLLVAGIFKVSPKSGGGAIESHACLKGIIRKGAILGIVLIASTLDTLLNTSCIARTIIITFFIGNEGISIIENLGLMGVKYPVWLKNSLEALKEKGESPKN